MSTTNVLFTLIISLTLCCCNPKKMNDHKYTNDLAKETSPYLLQHAHNPVDWKPWNNETLALAKKENKLILISIGYAACHWCHVMEHESFEDEEVAKVMNTNFINIKIDREERPDIDQVYMDAVQLMTGQGGWPLNCITLPDGRPIYGGTYFQKPQWISILTQLSDLYKQQPEKAIEYAEKLTNGIQKTSLITVNSEAPLFTKNEIDESVNAWEDRMDKVLGGNLSNSNKFPIPNNYQFLLRYAFQTQNKALLEYTNTTLTHMAYGGIYDQLAGGFSRYSVDVKWHVPHFEKMLYDNGQLVSLYSEAYLLTKKDLYKNVVIETLDFVASELMNSEGAFYSSLDADSIDKNGKLEEGAYYVWNEAELKSILKSDFNIFSDYYNVNHYGYWEHDNYVLIRKHTKKEISEKHKITVEDLNTKIATWKKLLLNARESRDRPRLDDKTLTSWNAIMLKGYADAYKAFNDQQYLDIALKNANFIIKNQLRNDGGLNHNYKNGISNINGHLEDYATLIDAFITLYEVTLDETWLNYSKQLTDYILEHFYDTKTSMFFFTSDEDTSLINRKIDISDNVIPSSNSITARNLLRLGHYYANSEYTRISRSMLNNVKNDIISYPAGYSNWLQLMCDFTGDYYEIAISGEDAQSKLKEINLEYIPNKQIAGSTKPSKLPLLENKFNLESTYIYICKEGVCKAPKKDVKRALLEIKTAIE